MHLLTKKVALSYKQVRFNNYNLIFILGQYNNVRRIVRSQIGLPKRILKLVE